MNLGRWFWVFLLLAVIPLAGWGCAMQRLAGPLPTKRTLNRDQLVIHSDFRIARQHRLLEEITARRADITRLLDLPVSDEPIHVYLFGTSESFHNFISKRFPKLPARRAFFVEDDTRLTVYAHWGERIAEDLRHEVSHGYLHAVVPNLPLWLDEGLAEFFEVPRGFGGVNQPHIDLLRKRYADGTWRPDLARLDQLGQLGSMEQIDYAESWIWVHWLLRSEPEHRDLLCHHLARLRTSGTAPPLSEVLRTAVPNAVGDLLVHLDDLAESQGPG